MKSLLKLTILLTIILGTYSVDGQQLGPFYIGKDSDWNIVGGGARPMGMAGAYISVADDASALSWNPAGIAQVKNIDITLCSRLTKASFGDGDTPKIGTDFNFGALAYPFRYMD